MDLNDGDGVHPRSREDLQHTPLVTAYVSQRPLKLASVQNLTVRSARAAPAPSSTTEAVLCGERALLVVAAVTDSCEIAWGLA